MAEQQRAYLLASLASHSPETRQRAHESIAFKITHKLWPVSSIVDEPLCAPILASLGLMPLQANREGRDNLGDVPALNTEADSRSGGGFLFDATTASSLTEEEGSPSSAEPSQSRSAQWAAEATTYPTRTSVPITTVSKTQTASRGHGAALARIQNLQQKEHLPTNSVRLAAAYGTKTETDVPASARLAARAAAAEASTSEEEHTLRASTRQQPARPLLSQNDEKRIFELVARMRFSNDEAVLAGACAELEREVALDVPCTSLLLKRQLLDAALALLHSDNFEVHAAAARLLTRLVRGIAQESAASCDEALATNVDDDGGGDDEVPVAEHIAHSLPLPAYDPSKPASSKLDVDGTHCTIVEAMHAVGVHALGLLRVNDRYGTAAALWDEVMPWLAPTWTLSGLAAGSSARLGEYAMLATKALDEIESPSLVATAGVLATVARALAAWGFVPDAPGAATATTAPDTASRRAGLVKILPAKLAARIVAVCQDAFVNEMTRAGDSKELSALLHVAYALLPTAIDAPTKDGVHQQQGGKDLIPARRALDALLSRYGRANADGRIAAEVGPADAAAAAAAAAALPLSPDPAAAAIIIKMLVAHVASSGTAAPPRAAVALADTMRCASLGVRQVAYRTLAELMITPQHGIGVSTLLWSPLAQRSGGDQDAWRDPLYVLAAHGLVTDDVPTRASASALVLGLAEALAKPSSVSIARVLRIMPHMQCVAGLQPGADGGNAAGAAAALVAAFERVVEAGPRIASIRVPLTSMEPRADDHDRLKDAVLMPLARTLFARSQSARRTASQRLSERLLRGWPAGIPSDATLTAGSASVQDPFGTFVDAQGAFDIGAEFTVPASAAVGGLKHAAAQAVELAGVAGAAHIGDDVRRAACEALCRLVARADVAADGSNAAAAAVPTDTLDGLLDRLVAGCRCSLSAGGSPFLDFAGGDWGFHAASLTLIDMLARASPRAHGWLLGAEDPQRVAPGILLLRFAYHPKSQTRRAAARVIARTAFPFSQRTCDSLPAAFMQTYALPWSIRQDAPSLLPPKNAAATDGNDNLPDLPERDPALAAMQAHEARALLTITGGDVSKAAIVLDDIGTGSTPPLSTTELAALGRQCPQLLLDANAQRRAAITLRSFGAEAVALASLREASVATGAGDHKALAVHLQPIMCRVDVACAFLVALDSTADQEYAPWKAIARMLEVASHSGTPLAEDSGTNAAFVWTLWCRTFEHCLRVTSEHLAPPPSTDDDAETSPHLQHIGTRILSAAAAFVRRLAALPVYREPPTSPAARAAAARVAADAEWQAAERHRRDIVSGPGLTPSGTSVFADLPDPVAYFRGVVANEALLSSLDLYRACLRHRRAHGLSYDACVAAFNTSTSSSDAAPAPIAQLMALLTHRLAIEEDVHYGIRVAALRIVSEHALCLGDDDWTAISSETETTGSTGTVDAAHVTAIADVGAYAAAMARCFVPIAARCLLTRMAAELGAAPLENGRVLVPPSTRGSVKPPRASFAYAFHRKGLHAAAARAVRDVTVHITAHPLAPNGWDAPFAQLNASHWIGRLTRDCDARIRALGWNILASLIAPSSRVGRRVLFEHWPELVDTCARIAADARECAIVRRSASACVLAACADGDALPAMANAAHDANRGVRLWASGGLVFNVAACAKVAGALPAPAVLRATAAACRVASCVDAEGLSQRLGSLEAGHVLLACFMQMQKLPSHHAAGIAALPAATRLFLAADEELPLLGGTEQDALGSAADAAVCIDTLLAATLAASEGSPSSALTLASAMLTPLTGCLVEIAKVLYRIGGNGLPTNAHALPAALRHVAEAPLRAALRALECCSRTAARLIVAARGGLESTSLPMRSFAVLSACAASLRTLGAEPMHGMEGAAADSAVGAVASLVAAILANDESARSALGVDCVTSIGNDDASKNDDEEDNDDGEEDNDDGEDDEFEDEAGNDVEAQDDWVTNVGEALVVALARKAFSPHAVRTASSADSVLARESMRWNPKLSPSERGCIVAALRNVLCYSRRAKETAYRLRLDRLLLAVCDAAAGRYTTSMDLASSPGLTPWKQGSAGSGPRDKSGKQKSTPPQVWRTHGTAAALDFAQAAGVMKHYMHRSRRSRVYAHRACTSYGAMDLMCTWFDAVASSNAKHANDAMRLELLGLANNMICTSSTARRAACGMGDSPGFADRAGALVAKLVAARGVPLPGTNVTTLAANGQTHVFSNGARVDVPNHASSKKRGGRTLPPPSSRVIVPKHEVSSSPGSVAAFELGCAVLTNMFAADEASSSYVLRKRPRLCKCLALTVHHESMRRASRGADESGRLRVLTSGFGALAAVASRRGGARHVLRVDVPKGHDALTAALYVLTEATGSADASSCACVESAALLLRNLCHDPEIARFFAPGAAEAATREGGTSLLYALSHAAAASSSLSMRARALSANALRAMLSSPSYGERCTHALKSLDDVLELLDDARLSCRSTHGALARCAFDDLSYVHGALHAADEGGGALHYRPPFEVF